MATYGQIQANLATMLSRSDLTTNIQQAILGAVKFYQNEPLWFTEDTFTKTLSASQSNYTLTGSLSLITSILSAKLTANGRNSEVRPVLYQDMETIDQQGTGEPSRYARWANQIKVDPLPRSAYTLTFRAYRKFVTLSATGDTNAWTEQAEELIQARALWWLSMTKTRNYELATAAKAIETSALAKLRDQSSNAVSTGKIKPTEF